MIYIPKRRQGADIKITIHLLPFRPTSPPTPCPPPSSCCPSWPLLARPTGWRRHKASSSPRRPRTARPAGPAPSTTDPGARSPRPKVKVGKEEEGKGKEDEENAHAHFPSFSCHIPPFLPSSSSSSAHLLRPLHPIILQTHAHPCPSYTYLANQGHEVLLGIRVAGRAGRQGTDQGQLQPHRRLGSSPGTRRRPRHQG